MTTAPLGEIRARRESVESLRDLPRYSVAEAARYVRLPKSTLGYWVKGGSYTGGYFEPVIELPDPGDGRLSFANLIEAHVLRALRRKHRIDMRKIRTALEYTREECEIDRLLLSRELLAAPGKLFLRRYEELEDIGEAGQLAMEDVLEAHLERIEWDLEGLARRLFPATRDDVLESPKIIVIDPLVSFGRPMVDRAGIKTSVIARRFEAGESIRVIGNDFNLKPSEVEEALRYERRAA